MTTETDLVPCPFCGSQASLETQVHSDSRALYLHWHAKVGCVFCFASTGWVIVSNRLPEEDHYVSQDDISKDRVQDVVEIWNARVPSPPAKVYMAHNRTSSLLFATKEAAFYRDEIAQERKRLRKLLEQIKAILCKSARPDVPIERLECPDEWSDEHKRHFSYWVHEEFQNNARRSIIRRVRATIDELIAGETR